MIRGNKLYINITNHCDVCCPFCCIKSMAKSMPVKYGQPHGKKLNVL